ncbi:hypothetical protein EYV94_27900 [Puteibacter caeruleilacunae]|nr:hypothetical protein EYV94_27900 [Puteibacter caeruleilacunae]
MKKLNKLTINKDKLMKNEELVNLRGGYTKSWYYCTCTDDAGEIVFEEDIMLYEWAVDRHENDLCMNDDIPDCNPLY